MQVFKAVYYPATFKDFDFRICTYICKFHDGELFVIGTSVQREGPAYLLPYSTCLMTKMTEPFKASMDFFQTTCK